MKALTFMLSFVLVTAAAVGQRRSAVFPVEAQSSICRTRLTRKQSIGPRLKLFIWRKISKV